MKRSSSFCLLLHTSSCWSITAPHILRRTPISNTSSLRSNFLVNLHVSDPYVTTGRTMVVYAFSFVLRDAHLLDNKIFIEHTHQVPAAILSVISASTSSYSVSTGPRYVNLSTVSTCMPPRSNICPACPSSLVTFINLVFSIMTCRPAISAFSLKILAVELSSGKDSPIMSTSLANSSLSHLRSPRHRPPPAVVFLITYYSCSARLNRLRAIKNPCRSPLSTRNLSVFSLPTLTQQRLSS